MKRAITAFVVATIAVAFLLGLARGFDALAAIIFGLIVACGTLVIAVVNRSGSGIVGPSTCERCGGLISASAPYCKHCGAAAGGRAP